MSSQLEKIRSQLADLRCNAARADYTKRLTTLQDQLYVMLEKLTESDNDVTAELEMLEQVQHLLKNKPDTSKHDITEDPQQQAKRMLRMIEGRMSIIPQMLADREPQEKLLANLKLLRESYTNLLELRDDDTSKYGITSTDKIDDWLALVWDQIEQYEQYLFTNDAALAAELQANTWQVVNPPDTVQELKRTSDANLSIHDVRSRLALWGAPLPNQLTLDMLRKKLCSTKTQWPKHLKQLWNHEKAWRLEIAWVMYELQWGLTRYQAGTQFTCWLRARMKDHLRPIEEFEALNALMWATVGSPAHADELFKSNLGPLTAAQEAVIWKYYKLWDNLPTP